MRRIFQHYKGEIPEFIGLQVGHAKAVVNEKDSSLIVLWLSSRADNTWYRIFMDGSYCGIDECKTDASHQDLDEGVKIEDVSSWFENACILSARIKTQEKENQLCLILQFDNQRCSLVYDIDSHHCSMKRIIQS